MTYEDWREEELMLPFVNGELIAHYYAIAVGFNEDGSSYISVVSAFPKDWRAVAMGRLVDKWMERSILPTINNLIERTVKARLKEMLEEVSRWQNEMEKRGLNTKIGIIKKEEP